MQTIDNQMHACMRMRSGINIEPIEVVTLVSVVVEVMCEELLRWRLVAGRTVYRASNSQRLWGIIRF